MWVVFELEEPLDDEISRLYGPFETREDAEHYCQLRGLDGVIEVERPDAD